MGSTSRSAVKNFLTEKCENWTTRESLSLSLTIVTKLEHVNITASSSASHRQLGLSFGIPSPLKSKTSTSASSSTRSGRMATTRHCSNRYACPWLGFLISLSIRSYVSSKLSGSSSIIHRTLGGKQCLRTSSWQNTHLNLFHLLTFAQNRWQLQVPYIPCAFSDSVLTTRSLSSSLHLRIRWSERTNDAT